MGPLVMLYHIELFEYTLIRILFTIYHTFGIQRIIDSPCRPTLGSIDSRCRATLIQIQRIIDSHCRRRPVSIDSRCRASLIQFKKLN